MAIDDPARLAFTAMHADEKQAQAVLFLRSAVARNARMGITVQPLLTGIRLAFRPMPWQAGSTTTTEIAHIAALAASRSCPDSSHQK